MPLTPLERALEILRPEENVVDDPEGLICMYCGESGFEDRDDLEDHLDEHPFLTRRADR